MADQVKLVPLHLVDPPDNAMRIEMDEGRLQELQNSMAAHGLDTPIHIRARGGRFYIIAGHRRVVCANRLGWAEIKAFDHTGDTKDDEGIKARENLMRDNPNDAEVAEYLRTLMAEPGCDLDKLMGITGKSEDWIAKRLALLRGDERIFHAVREGKLNTSQATVLNKFPDNTRTMYIEQALLSTPPARVLEDWLRDAKMIEHANLHPEAVAAPATASPIEVIQGHPPCVFCGENTATWTMLMVWVHKRCADTLTAAVKESGIAL